MVNPLDKFQDTKIGGILRTVGLWVLILATACMLFWLYATGEFIWLGVFSVIALWIGYKEIWGLLIGYTDEETGQRKKMTISTAYTRYFKRVGNIAYVPLALFWLAMTGLVLHLATWGGDKKK